MPSPLASPNESPQEPFQWSSGPVFSRGGVVVNAPRGRPRLPSSSSAGFTFTTAPSQRFNPSVPPPPPPSVVLRPTSLYTQPPPAHHRLSDPSGRRFAFPRRDANLGGVPEGAEPLSPTFASRPKAGAEMQDSPRGSSGVSSPVASRKEAPTTTTNSAMPLPIQYAPPGSLPQVLVDPQTGQHYLVPQAAAAPTPQPLFYQPVFYPGGAPQQQLYYPAYAAPGQPIGPHPGYIVTTSSTGSLLQQYGQRFAMSPQGVPQTAPAYPHRMPPSLQQQHSYPATTMSSDESSRREPRFNPEEPPPSPSSYSATSLPVNTHLPPTTTTFAQTESPPTTQPEDPANAGERGDRVTTSSSSAGSYPQSHHHHRNSQQHHGPTPLYGGPPPWWGRRDSVEEDDKAHTDVETSRRRVSPPTAVTTSDSECVRYPPPNQPPPPPPPERKAVRMDIDFNKPLPDEEPAEEQTTPKKAPRAPPTAFTIAFDTPSSSTPGGSSEGLSLQDAARKTPQVRRLMHRKEQQQGQGPKTGATPPTAKKPEPVLPPQEPTSKHYLLSKLLQGTGTPSEELPPTSMVSSKRDSDAVSQATYVLSKNEQRHGGEAMSESQILDSDSSSDTSTSTSTSSSRTASPSNSTADPSQVQPTIKTAAEIAAAPIADRRAVLQELARLRIQGDPLAPKPPAPAPLTTRRSIPTNLAAADHGRLSRPTTVGGVPARTVVAPPRPGTQPTSTANNNNFRRGDGGRFSMRSAAPPTTPSSASRKPPFKQLSGSAPSREQEMTAWLRRKDYNPMKAAAEAKKNAAALKASLEDLDELSLYGSYQFVQNRSISFHVGNQKPPGSRLLSDISESGSTHKSHEELAGIWEEGAGSQVGTAAATMLAEYSKGVQKDLNRLSMENTKAKDTQQLTGIAKAVDLLSKKCKKSIDLIRSQNKGCLSVSVEDLLSIACEPPRQDESLNEQLDRLSDAFDAVQRYLEQYSLDADGRSSPAESGVSLGGHSLGAFSLASPRQLGLGEGRSANPPAPSSYVAPGKPQAPHPRAARTSAYRSRILAAQRDSSTGRPGKNN